jgi:hypothetical protein
LRQKAGVARDRHLSSTRISASLRLAMIIRTNL